jgi:hypothetical protein
LVGGVDLAAVEACVRQFVVPTGPLEVTKERPWAATAKVPTAGGVAWFKQCAPIQDFEPRLTATLAARTPELLPVVLGWSADPPWLVTADAGVAVGDRDDRLELWERLLPRYAELQQRETAYAADHLSHGVPDRRPEQLPEQYEQFLTEPVPAEPGDLGVLRGFAPEFADLCSQLAGSGVAPTVQHDDLHSWSLHVADDELRIIDWGDASIAHPMASLLVVFEFLTESGLPPDGAWRNRLRDAYLEPWGRGQVETCELAVRVGAFARMAGWARQRAAMGAVPYRDEFDDHYRGGLRDLVRRVDR